MHRQDQTWIVRELYSAQLTTSAYTAAADAITQTIAQGPESETVKNSVLVELAEAMGRPFNSDHQGHPTLSPHPQHTTKPPATIGEMKKRFEHLRNQLSGDILKQDICGSAAAAAIEAASHVMENSKSSRKH